MTLTQRGLALNCIGSATVGWAAYFGIASGYGAVVRKRPWMEAVFWFGWILLTVGFVLQLLATRS